MHNFSKTAQLDIKPGKEFRQVFIRWSWILYATSSLFQLVFFPDFINFMMILSVGLAWFITIKLFLTPSVLKTFPLSAFLILGFTATQFYFPLLFTTLEGKPLIYNLELPEQVFLHSGAALLVLVIAHALYRLLSKLTYSRSFSLMNKAGFFDPPKELQVWLMGLIGMASFLYVFLAAPEVAREVTGSPLDKLAQGLVPFSYAPFFIPFGRLYGAKEVNLKRVIPMLVFYTIILFLLSIGRNSRGAFMLGFTAIGFGYLLGLLLGVFKVRLFSLRNVFAGIVLVWLLVGPLADLGTAMVIVRTNKLEVPPLELINLTLQTFNDKEAIRTRRLNDSEREGEDWDERYLDNVFTTRFANIKFNDASLVQASIVREYDPYMFEFSMDYLLATFPDPVLKWLKIDVDKEHTHTLSIGDFLYAAAGGSGPAGGFRTGHFAGTGITAFGWWYLFLLGLSMILVFFLFDKFLKKKNIDGISSNKSTNPELQFSFCGVLFLTSIFMFLPKESVVQIGQFLIRGWIQLAFLYLLTFHVTRFITKIVSGSRQLRFKRA